MTREDDRRGALEAIDRILNRGGDADDVLRAVLAVLGRLFDHAALAFVEEGRVVEGPAVGTAHGTVETRRVVFAGAHVADLRVAPATEDDGDFLARVATLISPYALVGWDTGGESWEA